MNSRFNISEYFCNLGRKLFTYEIDEIENSLLGYIIKKKNLFISKMPDDFRNKVSSSNHEIEDIFIEYNFPTELEVIIEFFEFLTDDMLKNENGMVFTPKYISDYIVSDSLSALSKYSPNISIIDPSCGCGIFLISAIEYIAKKFDKPIPEIIANNIYGIDIINNNVLRCRVVLLLLCLYNNYDTPPLSINIRMGDSLNTERKKLFPIEKYDFIIGNPPYVNTHDMSQDTIQYLKSHYSTTKKGVFNIFYAFIERSLSLLSVDGCIEFIVPNNFLTIKSAVDLRIMLQQDHNLLKIIDFANNMVFRPVRTYNCIIKLAKNNNAAPFEYYVMPDVENIDKALNEIKFNSYDDNELDENGWKLVDNETLYNLRKIENQGINLKDSIRTGIATLKDSVYMVSRDENGFFKTVGNKRYEIEEAIVKPIYKIPELKKCTNPDEVMQYIIFPYYKNEKCYVVYSEDHFMNSFPLTYDYLSSVRAELDSRDKGKKPVIPWFAYGRSQGLNKYGKKLVFPTFADKPKFYFINYEDALFCNGYAVFENPYFDLGLVQKILNSKIMQYYISNTSYAIEGGYFCYQKKYIERFSLPLLNDEECKILKYGTCEEIDDMLVKAYALVNV